MKKPRYRYNLQDWRIGAAWGTTDFQMYKHLELQLGPLFIYWLWPTKGNSWV